MKAFFVVALSLATVLFSIPALALDSRGFDSRGICRLSQGCMVDPNQGSNYNGPRNYRDFNGRGERNDKNDRDRDNRRYRNQNRSDNSGAATSRLAAGLAIEVRMPPRIRA